MWLPLGPLPVLAYSLRAFDPHVSRLVLVVSREKVADARVLAAELGIVAVVCEGGERRQDSVWQGLRAAGDVELVAIHDAARPLVSGSLIEACFAAASAEGAAIAAVPVRDTVKMGTEDGHVAATVDRNGLWAAQTPQAFRTALLRLAYEALGSDVTDDAAALEKMGHPVKLVQGDPFNFKLTTREDLDVARALVSRRARAEGF